MCIHLNKLFQHMHLHNTANVAIKSCTSYILVDVNIILGTLESDFISNLLDTEYADTSVLPPPKDRGMNLIITSH